MSPIPTFAHGVDMEEVEVDQCDECRCWSPRDEMARVGTACICVECQLDHQVEG